jgi:hypothetical protein
MIWTTQAPTKLGWYWFRRVSRDTIGEAECVRLREAFPSELKDDRLYMRNLAQDTRRVDWMNFSNLGERHHAYYSQAIEEMSANGPGRWSRRSRRSLS